MWAIFFILGLIIGSFLNVAILRHNTGKSLAGRSGCMSCATSLTWRELFPIISFFALRGKCKSCGSKISWQYPIVEFSLATLFALVYLQGFSLVQLVLALSISTLALFIAVYDTRHTIIPNFYVYTFVVLALLWNLPRVLWLPAFDMWPYLAEVAFSATVLSLPFALLWLVSKGKWIGLGDAKLMFGIGAMLGLWGGFVALTIGSIVGAVLGLGYVAFDKLYTARLGLESKRSTMKLEVPYGPFLIFGFFLVWLLHIDSIYLSLFNL